MAKTYAKMKDDSYRDKATEFYVSIQVVRHARRLPAEDRRAAAADRPSTIWSPSSRSARCRTRTPRPTCACSPMRAPDAAARPGLQDGPSIAEPAAVAAAGKRTCSLPPDRQPPMRARTIAPARLERAQPGRQLGMEEVPDMDHLGPDLQVDMDVGGAR